MKVKIWTEADFAASKEKARQHRENAKKLRAEIKELDKMSKVCKEAIRGLKALDKDFAEMRAIVRNLGR